MNTKNALLHALFLLVFAFLSGLVFGADLVPYNYARYMSKDWVSGLSLRQTLVPNRNYIKVDGRLFICPDFPVFDLAFPGKYIPKKSPTKPDAPKDWVDLGGTWIGKKGSVTAFDSSMNAVAITNTVDHAGGYILCINQKTLIAISGTRTDGVPHFQLRGATLRYNYEFIDDKTNKRFKGRIDFSYDEKKFTSPFRVKDYSYKDLKDKNAKDFGVTWTYGVGGWVRDNEAAKATQPASGNSQTTYTESTQTTNDEFSMYCQNIYTQGDVAAKIARDYSQLHYATSRLYHNMSPEGVLWEIKKGHLNAGNLPIQETNSGVIPQVLVYELPIVGYVIYGIFPRDGEGSVSCFYSIQ